MEKKPVSVELKASDLGEFTLRNGEMWVRVYLARDTVIIETNARADQAHAIGALKRFQLFPGELTEEVKLRVVLDQRLEDIEMSVRALNGVKNRGAVFIGQLAQLNEKDLLRQLNFGVKSLREVKELLAERGLALSMSFDWWSPPQPNA